MSFLKTDTCFLRMLQIIQLYIYPLKSLGGVSVHSAMALEEGFEYDRRWMLIDDQNRFITQREIPMLSLFRTGIDNDKITVQYGARTLEFLAKESTGTMVRTSVFDDAATGIAVSEEADKWFSSALDKNVRLIKLASDKPRVHFVKKYGRDISVSFADGYPYMMTGTASLDHLNSRMSEPVSVNRFRPNIVVSTDTPHLEDTWSLIHAGKATFENVKPCGRCRIITIEQETSTIKNETLTVLSQYRRSGNSVTFGVNLICHLPGMVRVGDHIIV